MATMRYGWYLLLAAASLSGVSCSSAEGSEPVTRVLKRLQSTYPGAPIQEVKATALSGLYEVNLGGQVVYSDAAGRYLIFGRMHDMQGEPASPPSQETVQSPAPENAIDRQRLLDELAASADRNAIKYVRGNGAASLYLFSDPKCPYCRSLDGELEKLDDVTVYNFVYPVLSDESKRIAAAVWCAKDRAAAWKAALRNAGPRAAAACETPIEANLRMAKALGVRGTPTLLNGQGRVLVGYQTAENVARQLISHSEKGKK